MNEIQQKLLDYLQEEADFYRRNRGIFLSPADRAARVRFFEEAIAEIKRLMLPNLKGEGYRG